MNLVRCIQMESHEWSLGVILAVLSPCSRGDCASFLSWEIVGFQSWFENEPRKGNFEWFGCPHTVQKVVEIKGPIFVKFEVFEWVACSCTETVS